MKLEQEIQSLKETYTCVIVTHNIQQAMRIADYVLFIAHGKLVEHGEARQFFAAPVAAATASYLSSGV
jgi:phosphate transport system ATP-binding protein